MKSVLNNLHDRSVCDQGIEQMPMGLDLLDMSAWMFVACIFAWVRRTSTGIEGVVRYEGISIVLIATDFFCERMLIISIINLDLNWQASQLML